MLYHYVYRITSLIENKHYYGMRSSSIKPELDLGIKYFTSSTDLEFKNDFKQNPYNYKLKIISTFENRNDAILLEIKLHKKFNVKINPSFYNKYNQTSTGFDRAGVPCSESTKKLLSNIGKCKTLTKEHKNNISKARKGYIMPDSSRNKLSNSKKGSTHSESTKKKMSESSKGQIMSIESRNKLSKSLTNKEKTKEHCNNISKALTGFKYIQRTCPHCNLKGSGGNMTRCHFNNCKKRP